MDNLTEQQLLEQAVEFIQTKLPAGWTAGLQTHSFNGGSDTLLEIRGPQSSTGGVLVEVRKSIAPRDIEALLGASLFKRLRAQVQRPIMVITEYLSPRSRELLIKEDVSYLDMTGNLRLSLPYPALYLEAQGADANPKPEKRRKRGLRGAQVGNLVRALVDVTPPYGVTELAKKARVDPGYATRILETLEGEALIERAGRGKVIAVRWIELLKQRAAALDLLAPNKTKMFISQRGAAETRNALKGEEKIVVTGSFVAVELAPVAAPALLVVCTLLKAEELADPLKLLPTTTGGDVAIVRPENYGPFFNSRVDKNGINVAAPSQIAIDCLSGNGRMPSEGEALIKWMQENEQSWHATSLNAVSWPDWIPR